MIWIGKYLMMGLAWCFFLDLLNSVLEQKGRVVPKLTLMERLVIGILWPAAMIIFFRELIKELKDE